jgi:hypothetical protein
MRSPVRLKTLTPSSDRTPRTAKSYGGHWQNLVRRLPAYRRANWLNRTFFTWGNPPFRIDILTRISGITFEDAWSRRMVHIVNDGTGLTAPFISAADLIANKLEAGRDPDRLQDLADAQALRKAAEARNDDPDRPQPKRKRTRGRGGRGR